MERLAIQTLKEAKTRQVVSNGTACLWFSSVLWISADNIATLQLEGYSYFHQAHSELNAIGAPTRSLLVPPVSRTYTPYCIRVRREPGFLYVIKQSLRIAAGLLIAYGFISFAWFFVPMHPNGTEITLTKTLHIVMAAVNIH